MKALKVFLYGAWAWTLAYWFIELPPLAHEPHKIGWFIVAIIGFFIIHQIRIEKKREYIDTGHHIQKYDIQIISGGNVIKRFNDVDEYMITETDSGIIVRTDEERYTWNGDYMLVCRLVWVEYETPITRYY